MMLDTWLAGHPYLQPMADLHALVDAAAAEFALPPILIPEWTAYEKEFHAGVPLLRSAHVTIDLEPAEHAVHKLIAKLAQQRLPGTLSEQCRELSADLAAQRPAGRFAKSTQPHAISALSSHPGLLRFLRWTILTRYLCPVLGAFSQWREEERWLRNYCPACGQLPAMAQLAGTDPGRLRLLSCGCCRTRWRYRRTGCPFCDSQHDHRLASVVVDGESGLRIDYCDACSGYLKTYDGQGSEAVLLADWTSLHLDLLARERGLKRLAASLYDL
jgi:FdhE protein